MSRAEAMQERVQQRPCQGGLATLALGALGVAFGDIGTSPLYAVQGVFLVDGGIVRPTPTAAARTPWSATPTQRRQLRTSRARDRAMCSTAARF